MDFADRRKRALAAAVSCAAGAREVDALLVTHLPDVRWLCGFTGSNAALVLPSKARTRAVLFTDGRYMGQAKAETSGVRIVIGTKPAAVAACEWMANEGIATAAYDATHITVATLQAMRSAVSERRGGTRFLDAGALVATLREVKDGEEIRRMRAAAALGCNLFDRMLSFMEPGMAELTVAAELEHAARMAGAERMAFDTIVASGTRGAMPHACATSAKLPRRGFCTLDFGVVLDGYCSDMTRTVHFGRSLDQHREVYDSVLDAQLAGVAAVRDGVETSDVDEAARSVLVRAGLGKWFTHSTGHGVGLEIHEGPRIGKKLETVLKQSAGVRKGGTKGFNPKPKRLQSGMVITIEPGVYLPGKFGVRIEDTVLVTAMGCEILTASTKAWIEL